MDRATRNYKTKRPPVADAEPNKKPKCRSSEEQAAPAHTQADSHAISPAEPHKTDTPPGVSTSKEDKPPSTNAQADPHTQNPESNEDHAAPAHAQADSHPISPVEAHKTDAPLGVATSNEDKAPSTDAEAESHAILPTEAHKAGTLLGVATSNEDKPPSTEAQVDTTASPITNTAASSDLFRNAFSGTKSKKKNSKRAKSKADRRAARNADNEAKAPVVIACEPEKNPVRDDIPEEWFTKEKRRGGQGNSKDSKVWEHIRQLSPAHAIFTHDTWAGALGKRTPTTDFTHQCRYCNSEGKYCNTFLRIGRKDKIGAFRSDQAVQHWRKHIDAAVSTRTTEHLIKSFYQPVPRPTSGPADPSDQVVVVVVGGHSIKISPSSQPAWAGTRGFFFS